MAKRDKSASSTGTVTELEKRRASLLSDLQTKYNYPIMAESYDQMLSQPRWFIPTGESVIDYATGGGLPEGRIVRLYGPPGAGKTAYCITTMLQAMAMGAIVVWGDTDQSFDPIRVASFGDFLGLPFKPELFISFEPRSFEDFIDSIYRAMKKLHPFEKVNNGRPVFEQPLVFIYDALSSTPIEEEIEELPDEGSGKDKEKSIRKGNSNNQRAKIFRKELRKLSNSLGLHGAALLVSEHSTVDLNFMGRAGLTSSGGDGPKFHASTSVLFSFTKTYQDMDKFVLGQQVYWSVEKCRFQKPLSRGFSILNFQQGFLDIETMFEILQSAGVIMSAGGGNYHIHDPELGKLTVTRRTLREKFSPEWKEALKKMFLTNSSLLWDRSKKL